MKRWAWSLYGLLVAASVVYCACLFGGSGRWGRGDWDQFSFRHETPRLALLRDHQLPLWNPYVNGGNVLLAHPHCPAFSPWYLPTLLLGAGWGLRVSVVLFMALGATGMAALLRRWEVSAGGCFVGGVLLMMSTHFALHVTEGHLEWCALGLMPWVMLCLVRAERDWRFVILAGLLFSSGLLYGSIYIVAVFVPVFALWAVLEGIRTYSWRIPASCAAMIGLTFLLCAVVLFPRLDFLEANPRKTRVDEQVSPAAFARMLLDPRQADLFRQTRDVRNPPDAELDRLLPARCAHGRLASAAPKSYDTLKWHRLEMLLSTTSDWTDVRFQNFPYRLFVGGLGKEEKTPAQLNALPQTDEWVAIQNPDLDKSRQTVPATVYVRLPDEGDLRFLLTRGNTGATKLTVTRGDEILLDALHSIMEPGDLKNTRTFTIPRHKVLGQADPDEERPAEPWYRVEATLQTTAPWCDLQVVNSPYVFRVKGWKDRRQTEILPSMSGLATGSRSPGKAEAELEATLYFQRPEENNLRVALLQGPEGTSTLRLETPQGDLIAAQRNETAAGSGEKTIEYLLPRESLTGQLEVPTPLRWRLNRRGMWRDWHEYGCYLTWVGLATVVLGLVVSFRRNWPLVVAGLFAGLMALGVALPLSLWVLWKQLPMYGSLQVPSRFLVAVVFVLAVCGGYGVDRLGRWAGKVGGVWVGRLLVGAIGLAIYVELAVLGWNLFSDVFVCQPHEVPRYGQFAQRFEDEDAIRSPSMYSAHYPYLPGNSGVLREYENIAVPRGEVRVTTDTGYRGEAYLDGSHGTAEVSDWSMSRVKVRLEVTAADRLVLNQNYFPGWKAVRRGADGTAEKLSAQGSPGGLVSIGVRPGDREVEFYYLPDSFIRSAILSGVTLLGCLGLLLAGSRSGWKSWRLMRLVGATGRRCGGVARSPVAIWVFLGLALNVPFLICHPGRTLVETPLVRSLAINVVLFLAPGLPLVCLMVGRGWLRRLHLLWVIVLSFAVFVAVLVVSRIAGLPLQGSTIWNGTWIAANLAILLNVARRGTLGRRQRGTLGRRQRGTLCWGIGPGDDGWKVGGPLVAVAYLVFFFGAARVVPPMQDHDLDIQSPAYSLLTRFTPEVVNDRGLLYYFAHPLLLNCYEGASFLYFGELDYLARFDAATDRVRRAESGVAVEPAVSEFCRFSPTRLGRERVPHGDGRDETGTTRHQLLDVEEGNYRFDPPLGEWYRRGGMEYELGKLPAREFEVQILYDDYRHEPRRLQTRTPNIFLAALTVALLGAWIARRTGLWWLALLVSLTYATSPEVFVRSSYGGYFAISMFALLQILLAVERLTSDRSRAAWTGCLLAGLFAALANNKLVLLPAALVFWELARAEAGGVARRLARAIGHPVVLGFALGTIAFWIYGLGISPADFWDDHVRFHLVNRIIHDNTFGHAGYPTVPGLWQEFWEHTGYVLLPLGIVALGALCCRQRGTLCWMKCVEDGPTQKDDVSVGWRGMPGLWAIWFLLTAVAFSLIDWRQTKHLTPLLLPLCVAPARWAVSGRTVPPAARDAVLILVGVLFVGLLAWNLGMLATLVDRFEVSPIAPAPGW